MKFETTIVFGGKTATGFQVPDDVVARLGAGKRPAVQVTINGFAYRSTVAPMGGMFMVPLAADRREAAGVAAGDTVEVDIELDTAPREVTVPGDFRAALDSEPEAQRFFDALSYSNQLRRVLAVAGAKTPETRQRRIAKAIEELRRGKK